ncbi:MAG: peptide deformylase [Prevotellaceae bacterium]|jgi:peptide deformylase|nr:peptide deformylase [Prevotellaceae bacterium]
MILPVYTYGNAILRKQASNIDADYPGLKTLINNMYQTMYNADGIGLAAPQIGLPIRLLVIDLSPFKEDNPELGEFKITMINPRIIEQSKTEIMMEEGCLSIPGVYENVMRPQKIKISYFDADFNKHTDEFSGQKARVIQHEYDHLEGNLFTDKISPLRRQLIKSKLINISRGKTTCRYKTTKAL